MHWVLQNNIFNEEQYDTLIHTLERMNISHSVHKVVPFVGDLEPAIEMDRGNIICIGSYSMRHCAKRQGWYPGVFDLEEFDFRTQKSKWNRNMLNADSIVLPFKHVVFDSDDEYFIRPIADSKVFAGRVFGREEFNEWQKKVVILEKNYGNSLTGDTLVQWCRVKEIYREVRYWIVDGEIVTSSVYKIGDRVKYEPNLDERMDDYVRAMVNVWEPAPAFVIDICSTPNGFRVVEINTINSCGFYAADIPKLVEALEWNFTDED